MSQGIDMSRSMTKKTWLIWTFSLVLIHHMAFETRGWPQETGSASSTRRALLIGISHYQHDQLPPLPGSRNDIHVMRQVLTSRFGFTQHHTKLLVDQAATRKRILRALRKIVRDARPHDFLYIHYSGHGSQVKDLNGDELDDQFDETLVPYDARTEGVPDITDDELEHILSKLKTDGAIIVFDSCHSGTATRSGEVRTRSIPRDTRLDLYENLVSRPRGVTPLFSERYVFMTSAAAHERSLDAMVDGREHGIFTYSFFRTLEAISLGATNHEVFQKTQDYLGKLTTRFHQQRMPQPQLEAPPHRLNEPIFLLDTSRTNQTTPNNQTTRRFRTSWVSVQPITGGRVLLNITGNTEQFLGSVWKLYLPEQPISFGTATHVQATVVASYPHGLVAKVEPRGRSIPEGTRATLNCTASIQSKSEDTSSACFP